MVTKDNEAARFNEGKPQFSYIDFYLWRNMFDAYEDTMFANSKEACMHEILLIVSAITAPTDRQVLEAYLEGLQMLSYRLSLLYRDISITSTGLPDLRGFEDMARVLEFGAKKYARDNWRKGYVNKFSAADSLLRHLQALMLGEEIDPESGCHHIGHLMCNVMFLTNDLLYVDRNEQSSTV